ncbi:MAG: MarR family winged helix-turn-helix transcriptional regulator [Thermoplasmata archaeon]
MDQNEVFERLIKMKKLIIKINKMINPDIDNLNTTDIFIFMKIADNEGITMTKLSEITGFSSTMITFTVDELEKLSIVERKRGNDRRSQTLTLTEKGKSLKNEIKKLTQEKFSEFMKNIGEEKKAELIKLFDRIFEIFEKIK